MNDQARLVSQIDSIATLMLSNPDPEDGVSGWVKSLLSLAAAAAAHRPVCLPGGGGAMSTATPKKAAEPKVDLDSTRERLVRLGMQHAADQLEPRLSDTIKNGASPHRMLDQLLDEELVWREERRIRTALRSENPSDTRRCDT